MLEIQQEKSANYQEISTKISLVIPVYMNEKSITKTYDKLTELFESWNTKYSLEVLFVNDGSQDESLKEIKSLSKKTDNVKYISFSRNFGQVPAIIAGLKKITGDVGIIMSADLQDPPELIEQMIEEWQSGNKIVICSRSDREDSVIARTTSKIFYSLIKISVPNIPKGGFDFILMDKLAINEFNRIDERNRFFQGDVLWLGFPVKFIPYKRMKREMGKSMWTLSKKIKYFIDGFLNTSYLPIRFMSLIGVSTSFAGLVYSIVIVYNRWINHIPFEGWAPIMILLLIIGGLLMCMLGVIGEYVWRIYDETRNRPLYVIEEKKL